MQKTIDNIGFLLQHLNNAIPDTSKETDRATLQDKFNKLIDAKVLLPAP